MGLKETYCRTGDCIRLAQHRDQRRALVNTVMNLRAPPNDENVMAGLHWGYKINTYVLFKKYETFHVPHK
jgi:hypothetical protein